MTNIYVASPLGFAESTRPYLAALLQAVKDSGNQPIDPWSQPEARALEDESLETGDGRLRKLKEANRRVAQANEKSIRDCDSVIAVLDGADVDSGTASEVGFAYGIGKQIVGLRTDVRKTGDNEAAIVNLQVEHWIEASGGQIYRSLEQLPLT